ncbi:MAG: DoxX family protein, partial [Gemmatimonadota bacterium]
TLTSGATPSAHAEEHRRVRLATRLASAVRALLRTPADPAATVARIALGAMILPHGMQKLFGAFGGPGFDGEMALLTQTVGIPWIFAFLVIVAEFFGGVGLLLGLLGRAAALGVGSVMVGAALIGHVQHGFFMNWSGSLPAGAEGWEFHLLALALVAIVILRGSGAASLDRAISRHAN